MNMKSTDGEPTERDWLEGMEDYDRDVSDFIRYGKGEGWDDAVRALAWCLDNGPPEAALEHLRKNNPYKKYEVDPPF